MSPDRIVGAIEVAAIIAASSVSDRIVNRSDIQSLSSQDICRIQGSLLDCGNFTIERETPHSDNILVVAAQLGSLRHPNNPLKALEEGQDYISAQGCQITSVPRTNWFNLTRKVAVISINKCMPWLPFPQAESTSFRVNYNHGLVRVYL